MTQVSFFFHRDIKASRSETVNAFVAVLPRVGETVVLKINDASVKACVSEVIHHPAVDIIGRPYIFVILKVLEEA